MDMAYVFGQIVAWAFFAAVAASVPLSMIIVFVRDGRDRETRARLVVRQAELRLARAHVQWWLAVYQNPIGPCQKEVAAAMLRYLAEVQHGITLARLDAVPEPAQLYVPGMTWYEDTNTKTIPVETRSRA